MWRSRDRYKSINMSVQGRRRRKRRLVGDRETGAFVLREEGKPRRSRIWNELKKQNHEF